MDELLKHKDESGPIGDLARELIIIMNDYKANTISLEEKNELVEEVVKIYAAHDSADREVVARFAVSITNTLVGIV